MALSMVSGVLAASPLLAYQWGMKDQFAPVRLKDATLVHLDPLIMSAGFAGAAAVWGRPKEWRMTLCLMAAAAPFAWNCPSRFLSGPGFAGWILGAGICFDRLFEKISQRADRTLNLFILIVLFIVFMTAAPAFTIDTATDTGHWTPHQRTLTYFLTPPENRGHYAKDACVYFDREYKQISDAISAGSSTDDIIWSDFDYGAGLLGAMSQRATSSAMLPEMRRSTNEDPRRAATILVCFKRHDGKPPMAISGSNDVHGLKLLAETDLAYLYKNEQATAKRKIVKATVPFYLIGIIVLLAFLSVRVESLFIKRANRNGHF